MFPDEQMIKKYIADKLDDLYLAGFEYSKEKRVDYSSDFNFILNNGDKSDKSYYYSV